MKRIVILGSGESGTGAALLAKRLGYEVFVSDKSPIKEAFKAELDAEGIAWEEGAHTLETILTATEIVKSPGIPEKAEVMKAVREKGIPVIGEIELAWRHAGHATIVAITGSNGKTTTTNLCHHLLQYAGLPVRMGGNVGYSFARYVADDLKSGMQPENLIYVLEVSSFQLDDISQFRPHIAILLNITPDHLDRYEYQMEKYVRSKFRIAMNQKRGDCFITNADDPNIQDYLREHPEAVHCKMEQVKQSELYEGYVHLGDKLAFDLANTNLKGPHNAFNAACAIRAALRLGVSDENITEALYTFNPPPHRLEKVAVFKDITWINDSKATNVDSVFYALQAMDNPTVWIVGGQDKGNDYSPLLELVRHKVKAIVCMGVDNSKILDYFGHLGKPMVETRSAEAAVMAARQFAEADDTVLLSPACASFDLFKNYEHRGDLFREAVLNLQKTEHE